MDTENVELKLRKVTLEDLDFWQNWKRKGQPYWEKSMHTGKFDNQPGLFSGYLNVPEFIQKIKFGMIYIPASDIE